MTNRERIRTLRSTKALARFSESQLRGLAAHIDEQFVGAGSQLAAEGRLCHQLLIVASGRLETCHDGRRATLGPGDSFGWHAMQERGVNEASVSAIAPSRLLVMSHEQFRAVDGLTLSLARPPKFPWRWLGPPHLRWSLPRQQHLGRG